MNQKDNPLSNYDSNYKEKASASMKPKKKVRGHRHIYNVMFFFRSLRYPDVQLFEMECKCGKSKP